MIEDKLIRNTNPLRKEAKTKGEIDFDDMFTVLFQEYSLTKDYETSKRIERGLSAMRSMDYSNDCVQLYEQAYQGLKEAYGSKE